MPRRRDQARRLRRSSASTTAGGATSRRATCGRSRAASLVACLVADLVVYFASPVHTCGCRARSRCIDCLLTLAFVAGSRLLARTLIERPQARGLVARGKEVIVVGAGDAGQLIVQRDAAHARRSATRRSASSTTTRASGTSASHGVRVLGTTDELPHVLRDNSPDEVLIAIPSAPGELRQRVVGRARARRAGEDAARPVRADRGRRRPRAARSARSRSRTCSAASRSRSTSTSVAAYLADADRARHRRRRLDRLRALPPDRARRAGAAGPRRPRRDAAVRDRARARRRARLPGRRAGARRRRQPRQDAAGLRALHARASSSTPPRTSTCR